MTSQKKILLIFSLLILVRFGATSLSLSDFCNLDVGFITGVLHLAVEGFENIAKGFKYATVPDNSINFYLFTAQTTSPTLLTSSSSKSVFQENSSENYIFIIHGWNENITTPYVAQIAQTFLNTNPKSIIIGVDWSNFSSQNYLVAAGSVQGVGYAIADFILNMIENNFSSLANFHLIGHSLGAHSAGFAGKKIQAMTNNSVHKITGLDPAGPLFCTTADLRLSPDDAEFVFVVHTDSFVYGKAEPSGDVDVYFNCGGPVQPGCEAASTLTFPQGMFYCSHQKSIDFFINSINNATAYPAFRCGLIQSSGSSQVYAGEYIDENATGVYCVSTTNNAELCVGLLAYIGW